MKQIILFFTLIFTTLSFAQSSQNDLAVTFGALTIPTFNKHRIGVNATARYYVTDRFSVGGTFYTASPKYNHGFGYDTDRTLINMYGVAVPMQYDVLNTNKVTLGLGFANGILLNVLRNRNETREVEHYDPDTDTTSSVQVPKRLKTDSYYTLTPYAEASIKLVEVDKTDQTALFFTGKVGYQNAFGKGSFSKPQNFSNYVVSLGFTIKGTLD